MDDPLPTTPPGPPSEGWERACEGILRTEFGRRPSAALARAMAELRAAADPVGTSPESGYAQRWAWLMARVRVALADVSAESRSRVALGMAVFLVLVAVAGGGRWWMNRGSLEVVSVLGPAALLGSGKGETLRAGQRVRLGSGVRLESKALVRLQYPGEATRLELRGPAVLTIERSGAGKRLRLDQGEAIVVAARQPPGEPLRWRTPHGEAEVVGTVFNLAARRASTWLEVTEGVVALSHPASGSSGSRPDSVRVGGGEFAVAAESVDLVARPWEHGPSERPKLPLTLDFGRGSTAGDGDWVRLANGLRQRRVALTAWGSTPESHPGGRYFPASEFSIPLATSGSLLLEATVTVDQMPGDVFSGSDLQGRVGLKLYDGRALLDFLLSGTTPAPSQVFAYSELNPAPGGPSRVVAGGPGPALARGTFRLKAEFIRLESGGVRVAGKIWQGPREPVAWAIVGEVPEFGAVRALALDTMHCAATFTDVRAWLLD